MIKACEFMAYKDGKYATGEIRPGLFSRIAPSVVFYSRIIPIVYRASVTAKAGFYGDDEWAKDSCEIFRHIENTGLKVEIDGAENFQNLDGPCVFLGNHMSTMETFFLPGMIVPYRRTTFVVKQSLVDYPFFGHIMKRCDPVTVGRKNPRDDLKAVLEGGKERLGKGISIIIFPQTTRRQYFSPAEFNTIGEKLAQRSGVPIIPLAVKTDGWAEGRFIKDLGRVHPEKTAHYSFGKPIRIEGKGRDAHSEIVSFISGKLRNWGVEIRDEGKEPEGQ